MRRSIRQAFIALGAGLAVGLATSQALANAPAQQLIAPTQTNDGRVTSGSKSVWQKVNWAHIALTLDNDAICNFGEYAVWESGHMSPVFFIGRGTRTEGRSQIFEGGLKTAVESDVQIGEYRMVTTLREDGLYEVRATMEFNSEEDAKQLKNRFGTFSFPAYLDVTAEYVHEGQTRKVDGVDGEQFSAEQLEGAEFRFFPGEPTKSFRMIPLAMGSIKIDKNRLTIYPAESQELHFLLDIREPASQDAVSSNASPNGIDFVAIDDLHLPDYDASPNLLMNPSFEAGFRYWGMPLYSHHMIPLSYTNMFAIDEEVAHRGNRSMRMRAITLRSPLNVGTMALPLVPDQPYTLSFYAKSSVESGTSVRMWGRGLSKQLIEPSDRGVFFVTDDWKRYEVTFTPSEKFGAVYFFAMGDPETNDEAVVWIDDVQLEQGEMTDFAEPPLVAALTSSARGNFLEFGQDPDFELEVHGPANTTGTAEVRVEDFFFETVYETTLDLTFDGDGVGRATLDELSEMLVSEGLRGVWVARARFEVEGVDEPFTDHFRFSVMDFLKNEHEHNDLFNLMWTYALQMGGPEAERFLQREQAIGFGSYTYDFIHFAKDSPLDLDRERAELAARYGFESMGRPIVGIHSGGNGVISEGGDANKMEDIRDRLNPTDEELAEFEAIAELKARNRPWNDIWWFTGESNPAMMPLVADRESFAKWLLATHRGIKRGNPDAKVLITGGPWNMAPDSGTQWVEEYIQDTKELDPSISFDGAAGHHYRNFPENPDLDEHIRLFIEMLDRNGHPDWPVYVNEGGHYLPFNVPQLGISPYIAHSGNAWYIGPLSYDVGKSERISAAYTARNWLIGLKYADRVEVMHDFNNPARYVDFDFTSRPYDKIPNTLGRLLGNSKFLRDIRFAPMVRCYVFEDKVSGDVIAAVWGHDEGVDRFKESPPLYGFDFRSLEVQAIDLMENVTELGRAGDGKTVVPMSPFPLFLRVGADHGAALAEAIAAGEPIRGGGSLAQYVAYPSGPGEATLAVRSLVDRPVSAGGTLTINGREHDLDFEVSPLSEVEKTFDLRSKPEPSGLSRLDWRVEREGQTIVQDAGSYFLLGVHGSDEKIAWGRKTAKAIGPDTELRTAVLGDKLHLLLTSTPPSKRQSASAVEQFRGVGFYFDSFFTPSDLGETKRVNQDLAVYELIPGGSSGLAAMCRYVQGTQAGSGTDFLVAGQVQEAIEIIDRSTSSRAVLEVVIPQAVLSPLRLEPGVMFGLNVSMGPDPGSTVSLAPLTEFKNVREPGEIELVMGVIGP
jgi:hypothetical protein